MKKLIVWVLLGVLALGMFTACGKKDSYKKVGMLSMTNISDSDLNERNAENPPALPEGVEIDEIKENERIKIVFYDNLSTMVMALKKGDINEMDLPWLVAEYMVNQNEELEIKDVNEPVLYSGFSFMFSEGNEELRDRFNKAISEIFMTDVYIDMVQKYLRNVTKDSIEAVQMPSFPGAETIRVAITGDLPPFDYVDESGTPAGFNTALLAAIAEKLQVNIEFVSIDSASRAIALKTDKADVSFWAIAEPIEMVVTNVLKGENVLSSLSEVMSQDDKPEGTILSDSYFTDARVTVIYKGKQ